MLLFILESNITVPHIPFWQQMKVTINDFNLFPSVPPTIDQNEIKTQKISTKLFCILLVLMMTVLLLYTSLEQVTKTITINNPTVDKYVELYYRYSQTLSCPCTKTSISYEDILEIQYSFHQICSSIFITEDWIQEFVEFSPSIYWMQNDFLHISQSIFQGLKAMCELINITISQSLTQFYSNEYISRSVVHTDLLQSEIRTAVDQFRSSTTNSFLTALYLIRDTTQTNGFFSGRDTTHYIYFEENHVHMTTIHYGSCSCLLSPKCIQQSIIYDQHNSTIEYAVPGMYVGCYAIEALLQSTLECLYNQYCIDTIHRYHRENDSVQGTPLQQSNTTIYSKNSTVQDLVDQLMIDTWDSSIMYNRYYNECQPIQCTYSYKTRNDLILIITALVGLFGGLTTSLKIVVPRLVKMIRKRKPGKIFHTSA